MEEPRFGVTGMDLLAFLVVTMTLLGAALIGRVVPAVRAASVDPMVALRQGQGSANNKD